jgi:hypothetical protein
MQVRTSLAKISRSLVTLILVLGCVAPLTLLAGTNKNQTPATKDARTTKPTANIGSWTPPVDVGVVGIHAALLHTGKVVLWYYNSGTQVITNARLLDPVSGAITDITIPFSGDFFCAGLSFLADGRLFVTGGLVGNPYPGVPDDGTTATAIFDPATETWTQGPSMLWARWYPTNVEMADGKMLVLTGKDQTGALVLPMEVYDPATNTFTALPASANITRGDDTYLKMKLLPTGNFFMGGATQQTRLFNPTSNTWSNLGKMNFGARYHAPVVLLPGLTKAFTTGGTTIYQGGGATNTTEIIDLSAASPQWSYGTPMNIARYNHEMVILSDGSLLVVGGAQTQKYGTPILTPELYNVNKATWTEMADLTAPRTYHSTALLLPDGRVLSAGSDDPNNVVTGTTYQIFSPPYLSSGTRPTITTAPTSTTYGKKFTVTTPNASQIGTVALIKPAAVTHSNDMDQRYVQLNFTVGSGSLTVNGPANANVAPPGYYMLVILNKQNIPSVMSFVLVQ